MIKPDPAPVHNLRRRKGVVSFYHCLAKNLRDLETKTDDPNTLNAQRMSEALDLEFKEYHG
jgi:hypothetical protein